MISNRLLRDLDAVIHVKKGILSLGAGAKIPLRFDERGLSIVDLAAVLMAPQAVAHLIADAAEQADEVTSSSLIDTVSTHQLATNNASTTSKQVHQQSEQPLPSPVVCGQARDYVIPPTFGATIMPASLSKAAVKLQDKTPVINMEEPLSGAEDAQLSIETQCLKEWLTVEYVRPAGVNNLQEWSQITAEQGKHRGLDFGTIFAKDLRYAMVMARKSSLKSAWALSFKGYSQARLKKMAQQQSNMDKKAKSEEDEFSDSDDWKVRRKEEQTEKSKTQGPMAAPPPSSTVPPAAARASSKRPGPSTSSRMAVELD